MSNFGQGTTADEVAERYQDRIGGKVVVVTGCTWGGIGAETAKSIAKHGAELVIFTVRKQEQLDETEGNIKKEVPNAAIQGVLMDLASFDSIRRAASEVNKLANRIDVLINNAGVMACPYDTTKDGFEKQFGTNHLGHFLFTKLVKDTVFKSPSPRIVNLSSIANFFAPVLFDDINFQNGKETYTPFISYGQSKTSNILFTRELHDRYNKSNNLTAFTLHPGAIQTNLQRHIVDDSIYASQNYWGAPIFSEDDLKNLFWKSVPQGASTTMVAAFNDNLQSKSYLADCQDATATLKDYATDKQNSERLWKVSEEFIGESF
jgi:NAD(P)-dependent dehydrogenase (short-subunit alcohol dehydrogenase family)